MCNLSQYCPTFSIWIKTPLSRLGCNARTFSGREWLSNVQAWLQCKDILWQGVNCPMSRLGCNARTFSGREWLSNFSKTKYWYATICQYWVLPVKELRWQWKQYLVFHCFIWMFGVSTYILNFIQLDVVVCVWWHLTRLYYVEFNYKTVKSIMRGPAGGLRAPAEARPYPTLLCRIQL